MTKNNKEPEKDMFGYPIKIKLDRYEKLLARTDKETFSERLERLKYIQSIVEDISIAGTFETVMIFSEAGWAYVNGAFISTILLSQAFIERRLYEFMMEKGLEKEAKNGAQRIIKYCREYQLVNDFLLDKCDRLRQIRNPFVHVKPFDHPFNLDRRFLFEKIDPNELIEKDAKEALSLMYTLLLTRL